MKTKIEDIENELDREFYLFKENVPPMGCNMSYTSCGEEVKSFYRQKISELVREAIGGNRPMSKDDWIGKHQPKEIQKRMDDYRSGYNTSKSEILAAFKEAGVEI